jgi:hypothetical protein
MHNKNWIQIAAVCISAGLFTACMSEARLERQASINKTQAQEIALKKVPGGTIKEGELEKEHGRLLWSFDIATAGTKDITEVNIDASTGEVIAVEHETAEDEAREAKEERHHKKHHDGDDKDDKR